MTSPQLKKALASAILAVTAVQMPGCGGLDCTSDPQLQAQFNQGTEQARLENQRAYDDGKRAGLAYTYQQGYDEAYPKGYNQGFDKGYHSPEGYPKGRADQNSFNDGKMVGLQDSRSCEAGNHDGYNEGIVDGRPVGEHDGYADGYEDGYNNGFPEGYQACMEDGGSKPSEKNKAACYKLGYDSTRLQSEYSRGVADGKAANPDYQRGLTDGTAKGYTDGYGPGVQKGYNDGKIAAYEAGRLEGQQILYTNCFNASYPNGYQAGYSQGFSHPDYGYGTPPSYGRYDNGSGGYGDGFQDGYADGYTQFCGGSFGAQRYGRDQNASGVMSWARVSNGLVVDSMARPALDAELSSQISVKRANLRTEHRAEIMSLTESAE